MKAIPKCIRNKLIVSAAIPAILKTSSCAIQAPAFPHQLATGVVS